MGKDGGAKGIRTPDLLIANEMLYQLSYDPLDRLKNTKTLSSSNKKGKQILELRRERIVWHRMEQNWEWFAF